MLLKCIIQHCNYCYPITSFNVNYFKYVNVFFWVRGMKSALVLKRLAQMCLSLAHVMLFQHKIKLHTDLFVFDGLIISWRFFQWDVSEEWIGSGPYKLVTFYRR